MPGTTRTIRNSLPFFDNLTKGQTDIYAQRWSPPLRDCPFGDFEPLLFGIAAALSDA